jgi:RHS repeat-associated protein
VGNTSTFYTFDPQGNVCQRLDASGTVQATFLYDAWGQVIGKQPSNAVVDTWGYKGQWGYRTESETGLLLLGHRYYDAVAGRFLTRDPIGYSGGSNLYAYVGSNPVNAADPSGLTPYSSADEGMMLLRAYGVESTLSGAVDAGQTLADPCASMGQKMEALEQTFSGIPSANMRLLPPGPIRRLLPSGPPVRLLPPAGALSEATKDALRADARDIWQAVTGRRAIWDNMQVHHRVPLE